MLPERRATSYAKDPALGTVVVVCDGATADTLKGEHPARLLLDEQGHMVGVDIAPDRPERMVVMLGPHERVREAVDVTVQVTPGPRTTVTLHRQAARLVTTGASPYVF